MFLLYKSRKMSNFVEKMTKTSLKMPVKEIVKKLK